MNRSFFKSNWIPARTLLYLVCLFLYSTYCHAHESRPAYLEIDEKASNVLFINWTRPVRDELALNIHPVFPAACVSEGVISRYELSGVMHERWKLDCSEGGLRGKNISISGFESTISDVLLRFQGLDSRTHTKVLDSSDSVFLFPDETSVVVNVAPYYLKSGVRHILDGNDHLIFVFALLLLIKGFWRVIKTITAFTLAHSISLIAAVLGYVHVPSTPVEAVIALSIMFLACELLRGDQQNLSRKFPWLIAAAFGLIHGLGFAGALSEIGLPETEIPLALFMFNVGVELGQLLFIFVVIAVFAILAKFMQQSFNKVEFVSSYVIGSVGAFWFIERVSDFYW